MTKVVNEYRNHVAWQGSGTWENFVEIRASLSLSSSLSLSLFLYLPFARSKMLLEFNFSDSHSINRHDSKIEAHGGKYVRVVSECLIIACE